MISSKLNHLAKISPHDCIPLEFRVSTHQFLENRNFYLGSHLPSGPSQNCLLQEALASLSQTGVGPTNKHLQYPGLSVESQNTIHFSLFN